MAKERKFRAFTCKKCLRKHAWDVALLPEVGRGQCYFCQEVTSELWETPFIVITTVSKRAKTKGKDVDFL